MANNHELQFRMFSDPLMYYTAMLNDIKAASSSIYLEVYRFRNDPLGIRFRNNLIKKCREGVKVMLLIDSWGASSSQSFFQELIELGGELRFFKKIKLSWDGFTRGHRRDHRKILVIDDQITYIGSANISSYSFNWRESVFRIKGDVAKKFRDIIRGNYQIYNKYFYDKQAFTRTIRYKDFEIIRDVPSLTYQPVKKKLLELIEAARREVTIETPYFLPGSSLRKALTDAAQRGVRVRVIIPKKSDVGALDLLTSKYMGELAQEGVKFFFFLPQNLHSKIFLADRKHFLIGSSNFDYRSFRYMHEICLSGTHPSLVRQMVNHINETLRDSENFKFETWMRRPIMQRFLEWLLVPLRHLF
ncbi:MAG: phosphatidylserine/phosphatidylglycerophosphate/cardiolipin synthase family protein [Bacteroidales bacterium]